MPDRDFFRGNLLSCKGPQSDLGVFEMNIFYLAGLIVVIGIVVYLFIALLKPELFT